MNRDVTLDRIKRMTFGDIEELVSIFDEISDISMGIDDCVSDSETLADDANRLMKVFTKLENILPQGE